MGVEFAEINGECVLSRSATKLRKQTSIRKKSKGSGYFQARVLIFISTNFIVLF